MSSQQVLDYSPFMLSPIQEWLVVQNLINIHHWNQAFLLKFKKTVSYDLIKNKLTDLLNHYDIFKLRFSNTLTSQKYCSINNYKIDYIDEY